MTRYIFLPILLSILSFAHVTATTWDEPWADQVIKGSSVFVLGKVFDSGKSERHGLTIIRVLAGHKPVSDTVYIDEFYSLKLCSSSGHGVQFSLKGIDTCYFFLKEGSNGKYAIATPSTGFDAVFEGKVSGTYRHSYHQAQVAADIYEKTMLPVFNYYHQQPYDEKWVNAFVTEHLSKKPSGFGKDEIGEFFCQHVALELVFHLDLNLSPALILPFLMDKNNFHNQISGARAMRSVKSVAAQRNLLTVAADTSRSDFVRVMCMFSVNPSYLKELKRELGVIRKSENDEGVSFGGNIMDPRVCTHLPSLKDALGNLEKKNQKPRK
ncbi:MAG: hypothetical protein EOO45_03915 [Flavobacterium sp.]|nr:MAG: hypothetical protein EOO45_03915 [Flavobacterium sp.]